MQKKKEAYVIVSQEENKLVWSQPLQQKEKTHMHLTR
jgi:hypothetical protein